MPSTRRTNQNLCGLSKTSMQLIVRSMEGLREPDYCLYHHGYMERGTLGAHCHGKWARDGFLCSTGCPGSFRRPNPGRCVCSGCQYLRHDDVYLGNGALQAELALL